LRELLAACGPALLVIDDLHWADEGTRDLLRFLGSMMPGKLAIVVAYRDTGGHRCGPLGTSFRPAEHLYAARVSLGPLDLSSVRELAAGMLGEPEVSDEFAAKLHESTAGIPFVTEEILRALKHTGGPPPLARCRIVCWRDWKYRFRSGTQWLSGWLRCPNRRGGAPGPPRCSASALKRTSSARWPGWRRCVSGGVARCARRRCARRVRSRFPTSAGQKGG
jgi:hypothetical protein